jgi:protein-S-isoprenylcysteine O-methyltransferase Ste14
MIYLIPWLIFSALLLFFTLIRPHPYRFSRFLAFESLISLIFLNAKNWFVKPFSLAQIISWLFLLSSLVIALHGFFLLKTRGNPEGDFEDTTLLIKTGAYRYIRHPLYTSLLLFGWGAFLKDPSVLGGVMVFTLILGVIFTAKIEEKHNMVRFGQEYQDYCQETKRFIPGIY